MKPIVILMRPSDRSLTGKFQSPDFPGDTAPEEPLDDRHENAEGGRPHQIRNGICVEKPGEERQHSQQEQRSRHHDKCRESNSLPQAPRGGKRESWRDKESNLEEKLAREQDNQFVHQDMQKVPEEIIKDESQEKEIRDQKIDRKDPLDCKDECGPVRGGREEDPGGLETVRLPDLVLQYAGEKYYGDIQKRRTGNPPDIQPMLERVVELPPPCNPW